MKPFQHILVPTDFGPSAKAALDIAVAIATKLDAAITILHVCEIPALSYEGVELGTADLFTALTDAAEMELASLRAELAPRR